ncbi:hypothetical protein BSL78_08276 [Apostichopus japonicus]|uniref:Uncharacterized protein n=1 Tax=Stichopus japonicus TaxID=307972 RepID=A0A2G8L3L3_STIJA|nr:hypothetical protein BSL78_08276 [Apostichopus japonicus]
MAKDHTHISNQDVQIIMHSRKSLLFDNGTPWMKKGHNDLFDVTMGSYDGAEEAQRPPSVHPQEFQPPTKHHQVPASLNQQTYLRHLHDEVIFKKAAPAYEEALKLSNYTEGLSYIAHQPTKNNRNRKRNIIWFNPPFSSNVATNIGGTFLKLINKHFPKTSKLHKIFNRNTVKVSYSCMPNIASIIKGHNKRIAATHTSKEKEACNCRKKDTCPLNGNCQASNIIYKAEVKTTDNCKTYIGLTEPPSSSDTVTTRCRSTTKNTKTQRNSRSTSGS